jgi:hypothetical protein
VGKSLCLQFQGLLGSWVCVARKPKTPEPTPSPIQLRESTRQLRTNRVSRNFFEPEAWEKKPSARSPSRQDSLKDLDRWSLLGNTFSVRCTIISEIVIRGLFPEGLIRCFLVLVYFALHFCYLVIKCELLKFFLGYRCESLRTSPALY